MLCSMELAWDPDLHITPFNHVGTKDYSNTTMRICKDCKDDAILSHTVCNICFYIRWLYSLIWAVQAFTEKLKDAAFQSMPWLVRCEL